MKIQSTITSCLPASVKNHFNKMKRRPSKARKESNEWLKLNCRDIKGKILSIGSGNDFDGEGGFYKDYFRNSSSYTTSEVCDEFNCDLIIDIRSMPEIENEFYDCIFCSGVLEHVDDFHSGFKEITRILRLGGVLLLGLPFRQAIHLGPNDFWRFTEFGIKHLLKNSYELIEIISIDELKSSDFPATYWVKAKRIV